MIWQENIKTVVMLTNLNENRTIVCEKYWPKFGLKCRFGNIVILNVSSKMFPSYVKREFQVKYQNKTHRVQQFQYIKWPDHGVPTNLQEFTPFMKVISGISKHTSPILVHCNTGCGRTGTVILCDIVLKMGQYKKQVNFAEVLKQLRNQRPCLVSTVDHYIFVHRVVVEYFRQKKNH
ncbi:unnamed protein product [Tenebrio molitor]|jgi:protein tyrosine phosphatase|nr:unnamed protein product [Tenebrio molitor]